MEQNANIGIKRARSKTRSVAFIGLSIALIAVCSWVVIPLGPIPFTMQMFAIPLMICVLSPRDAIAAIYGYVALGAIGVPVFSGMRGGIGVLLGPTGGFLLGYLVAVPLAVGIFYLARRCDVGCKPSKIKATRDSSSDRYSEKAVRGKIDATAQDGCHDADSANASATLSPRNIFATGIWGIVAGLVFTFVAYAGGTIQYMAVGGVSLEVALATSVIPFIVPDIIKVLLAVVCAQSVRVAIGQTHRSAQCSI